MKINDFKLSGVFIQINLHKGFEILDVKGKLLKAFSTEMEQPTVNGDIGISLKSKDGKLREIAIDVYKIWFAFHEPDTFTYVKDHSLNRLKTIEEIVEVKEATRFGARMQFVGELKKKEEAFENVTSILKKVYGGSKIVKKDKIRGGGVLIEFSENSRNVLMKVNVVEKMDEKSDKKYALLYDFDYYETDENPIKVEGLKTFLNSAERFLREEIKDYFELSK